MRPRITEQAKRQLENDFKNGLSVAGAAEKYEIAHSTAHRLRKQFGIGPGKRQKPVTVDYSELASIAGQAQKSKDGFVVYGSAKFLAEFVKSMTP